MKKLICLGTFCLTSISLMAQTTCETRVDAHQEATTTQRVAYCLTPDSAVVTPASRGLVFSSVSTPAVAPTPAQSLEKPTAKAGYFKPQHYTITREYVDSAQFPQVPQGNATPAPVTATNLQTGNTVVATQEFVYVSSPTLEQDVPQAPTAPEPVAVVPATTAQPQVAAAPVTPATAVLTQDEFEYVTAPSTPLGRSEVVWVQPAQTPAPATTPAAEAVTPVDPLVPQEHFMIDEVDADGNLVAKTQEAQSQAGLKARHHKPGRQLMKADTPTVQIPAQDPAYTYHEDLTQPYEPEEIPTGTATYAPAASLNTTYDEIPAGTVSYAPATAN